MIFPISDFNSQLLLSVERKTDAIHFNTIVNFTDLPICRIVEGSEENFLISKVIEHLRPTAKDLFEICSRTGDIKVANISLANSTVLALFPSGDYRITVKFFDSADDKIHQFSYNSSVHH